MAQKYQKDIAISFRRNINCVQKYCVCDVGPNRNKSQKRKESRLTEIRLMPSLVNVINQSLSHSISYFYYSVSVITFSLTQSVHIMQILQYCTYLSFPMKHLLFLKTRSFAVRLYVNSHDLSECRQMQLRK
jgi:hypothetical protein